MKRVFVLLMIGLLTTIAAAQSTISQTLFTNSTAITATAANIRNINQTTHWLTYCVTFAAGGTVTVELDGSYDNLTYFPITQVSKLTSPTGGCAQIFGTGYYPYLKGTYSGLGAGQVDSISMWYGGSVYPISAPTTTGAVGPNTPLTTQEPSTFTSAAFAKSAATSLNNGTPAALYGAYVYNPNAVPVFVGLSGLNSCTVIFAGGAVCQQLAVEVPATSGVALPIPAVGVSSGTSAGNWYGYCSTSSTSLVDPTSSCWIQINFKTIVGVAPN